MSTTDRPYKIVYKSKAPTRDDQDDNNNLRRQSTRDSDSTFSQTSYKRNNEPDYPPRRPAVPRRVSSDDHFRRAEYSRPVPNPVVVVEAPRRRGTGFDTIPVSRGSRYEYEYEDRGPAPRRYNDDWYTTDPDDYGHGGRPFRSTESPLLGVRAAPALVSAQSYHRPRPDGNHPPNPDPASSRTYRDQSPPPSTIWSPNTDTATDISSLYARGRSTVVDTESSYNQNPSYGDETLVRAARPRGRDLDRNQQQHLDHNQQDLNTRPPPRSILRSPTNNNGDARRSRSVTLRALDSDAHDIRSHEAERQKVWHERPGREARHAGRYLGHDDDSDLGSESYFGRRWREKKE